MKLKSKKEQVLDYIKLKRHCLTSDVIRFGLNIHHTRAERDARNLASDGRIKRMSDKRKKKIYGKIRQDVWVFVK